MSYFKLGATIFAVLAVTAFVWASESDEIRARAQAIQREAAQLAEQGHGQEAAHLERRAMAMLEEAERLQQGRPHQRMAEIMEMKRLLEELRQEERNLNEDPDAGGRLAEVRSEAERLEMELAGPFHLPNDEHHGPHDEIARRLEHMRIAVEHLNHAGLDDVAEHVAQRAEAAERELQEHHGHHGGDVMHEIMRKLEEIRHEVGRLRDEVNELREKR